LKATDPLVKLTVCDGKSPNFPGESTNYPFSNRFKSSQSRRGTGWGETPWENPKKYVGNREENDDWKNSDVLFPSENKN
jgi:hypothetical protein